MGQNLPSQTESQSASGAEIRAAGAMRKPYTNQHLDQTTRNRADGVLIPLNRLEIVMAHTSSYAFEGQARLAADCGVSRSTISRLIRRCTNPSYRLVEAVTAALGQALGRPLETRELFSPDGSYPTPSGCELCGCNGCFPEEAYDRHGNLKPAFRNQQSGDWTLAKPMREPISEARRTPLNPAP